MLGRTETETGKITVKIVTKAVTDGGFYDKIEETRLFERCRAPFLRISPAFAQCGGGERKARILKGWNKMKRRTLLLLAAVMALAVALAGCGPLSALLTQDFDASKYVKGILDCTYLGEYADYMETTNATEEEAAAAYEGGLEAEAYYLASYLGFVDYYDSDAMDSDLRSEMIEFYRAAYQNSRYEVGEAVKSDSGFTVEVTIEPIDLFSAAIDELNSYITELEESLNAGVFAEMTAEEFYYEYASGMMAICEAHDDDPPHLEPLTLAILVTQDEDGLYTISDSDFQRIDAEMIYYP